LIGMVLGSRNWLLFLVLILHRCTSTQLLDLTPAGEAGQFQLTLAVSALPTGGGIPISALAVQNSAGQNRILIVDADNNAYELADTNNLDASGTPIFSMGFTSAGLAVLGGYVYATDPSTFPGQVLRLNADGSVNSAVWDQANNPLGLAANPITNLLYVATADGVYAVDPSGAEDPVLVVPAVANFQFTGIAFSADWTVLYLSAQGTNGLHDSDTVYGYFLSDGQPVEVSHSPDLPGALGLIAGTGCLQDYLFVLTNAGLMAIDFHGVDNLIAEHPQAGAIAYGYLSFDPWTGTVLIAETDGIYRLKAPACGGFAGYARNRLNALPVTRPCTDDLDCSSHNCLGGVCTPNGYLGSCQEDADCSDSQTPDGFFCQQPSVHAAHDRRGGGGDRDHDRDNRGGGSSHKWRGGGRDADSNRVNGRPAYGVCEINLCANSWGGCDANATCTPTADAQRVCSCNQGYFGRGLDGECVDPCLKFPFPCDPAAQCIAKSLTSVSCLCPAPTLFGPGTRTAPCLASPCAPGVNVCGAGICSPLTTSTWDCVCTHGNFQQAPPPDGSGYSLAYPQCVADRCALNNGDCPLNSICTPMGDGTRICNCASGYSPQGVNNPTACTLDTCLALSPGFFPLGDPHSVVGSCVGRYPGESCKVGCVDGWRPEVSGKAYKTVSARCVVHGDVNIYTFVPFDCISDPDAHASFTDDNGGSAHGHDDDDDDDDDDGDDHHGSSGFTGGWWCGGELVPTCVPNAPWFTTLDRVNRRIVLTWNPLHDSPLGDHLLGLSVHVTPSVGNAFSTSPIAHPDIATTTAIDNLEVGFSYVFRLVAQTNNGPKTGLPVSVNF